MSLSGVVRRRGALGLAGLLACAQPATRVVVDAGIPQSIQVVALDGAPATVALDAGPTALPDARFTALVDGGEIDLLLPDASIRSDALLRFDTSAQLEDVRIRVLTAEDRLADNHATLVVDDGGTHVALKPIHAWPSRNCCRFRVDGESGRMPSGVSAKFLPFEVSLAVERDPGGDATAMPPRRHHRRHRR
jgi:hypothetical protein